MPGRCQLTSRLWPGLGDPDLPLCSLFPASWGFQAHFTPALVCQSLICQDRVLDGVQKKEPQTSHVAPLAGPWFTELLRVFGEEGEEDWKVRLRRGTRN